VGQEEEEMPVRPFSRESQWLLPPRLDELVPDTHPVRFVAAFVDSLDLAAWFDLGIAPQGEREGAPAYHPALLLSVWLYGFMTGVRSSRRLEVACRDQLPYVWLTGNQRPDHNTLWRFYQEHRQGLRKLLKLTVRTAVQAGLIDLALQAVDGTKLVANASPDRNLSAKGLERLLERTQQAIEDLEAQNRTEGQSAPAELPAELRQVEALQAKVKAALASLEGSEASAKVNLTDSDAVVLRSRRGFLTGYNAQAVAAPLAEAAGVSGQLITAVTVVTDRNDVDQLLPLLRQAEANLGQSAAASLADAGYHSGPNLAACEAEERVIAMPESQAKALGSPYHKDAFVYDAAADSFLCPQNQRLRFAGLKRQSSGKVLRRYLVESPAACRACPFFGQCTTNKRQGRSLHIGAEDAMLRRHRAWMQTQGAKALYKQRKALIEPVFGVIKEQLGGRCLLLRGLLNVTAEGSLLATAFNLRFLARVWQSQPT
jgi:transposase